MIIIVKHFGKINTVSERTQLLANNKPRCMFIFGTNDMFTAIYTIDVLIYY